MIKRFNPKPLKRICRTDCKIVLYQKGLSEEGEPLQAISIIDRCRFVEKTKIIIEPDGKRVELVGVAVLVGDIAPGIKISGGEISIGNDKYYIYAARKPRNPDGSVHHTSLELM